MRWNSTIEGSDAGTIRYAEKLRDIATENVLGSLVEAEEIEKAVNTLDEQTSAKWWLGFVRATRIGDEFDAGAAAGAVLRIAGLAS